MKLNGTRKGAWVWKYADARCLLITIYDDRHLRLRELKDSSNKLLAPFLRIIDASFSKKCQLLSHFRHFE
jgi:hypothetical protein